LYDDSTTRRYGPGKWRMIQKDAVLSRILHLRSNVDLKDKWRNLHSNGYDRAASPALKDDKRSAPSTSAPSQTQGAQAGAKKRKTDDERATGSGEVGASKAFDAATNELFNETQRAKREAKNAQDAVERAEAVAAQAEREAWEAEKLSRELITESHRQKFGLPVEGTEDVAEVAAALLDETPDEET